MGAKGRTMAMSGRAQDEGRKVRHHYVEKYMENYGMGKAGPHWGGGSLESSNEWQSWPVQWGPGRH